MSIKKLLKNTSLAVLLTAITICSSIQPAFAGETLTVGSYSTKNLKTGIEITNNIPKLTNNKEYLSTEGISTTTSAQVKVPSSIHTDAVFDGDDRYQVTETTAKPYSAICYLEAAFPNGETMAGTAWVTDDDVAVTAGHCIYDKTRGGWAKTVTIWPGRNGNSTPYGSVTSKTLTVNTQWKKNSDRDYDYGVIKLNSKIGLKCDELGYAGSADKYLDANNKLYIAGYPNVNKYHQKMYEANGYADDHDSDTISYKIDTEDGQSGSPIMVMRPKNGYVVVGIHTNHDDTQNHGVKVTDAMSDIIDEVVNAK